MRIGGLLKSSFIDYPGKLGCVLFLSGCNFDCPYCHNPELVAGCREPRKQYEQKDVFDFLKKRSGFLEGVVISGGEPTLNDKELVDLCGNVKNLGYPVKLDTNGSKPDMIKFLMKNDLVDYIAMDLKTDPLLYDSLISKGIHGETIAESVETILNSEIPCEFRTTCVKPLVDDDIISGLAKLISGAPLFALQEMNGKDFLHPEWFHGENRKCTSEEIHHFKEIASPYVESCIIR